MVPLATSRTFDEEFNQLLHLARTLVGKLPRKHDRDIASKWIAKLCALKSQEVVVKRNRNQFFKYMLTVLHQGIHDFPAHYGYPQYSSKYGCLGEREAGADYMSRWSADRKIYVAVKPLPGRGALVYMAVSKQPELGWEFHN